MYGWQSFRAIQAVMAVLLPSDYVMAKMAVSLTTLGILAWLCALGALLYSLHGMNKRLAYVLVPSYMMKGNI